MWESPVAFARRCCRSVHAVSPSWWAVKVEGTVRRATSCKPITDGLRIEARGRDGIVIMLYQRTKCQEIGNPYKVAKANAEPYNSHSRPNMAMLNHSRIAEAKVCFGQLKSSSSLAGALRSCPLSETSIDPRYATTWSSAKRWVLYNIR